MKNMGVYSRNKVLEKEVKTMKIEYEMSKNVPLIWTTFNLQVANRKIGEWWQVYPGAKKGGAKTPEKSGVPWNEGSRGHHKSGLQAQWGSRRPTAKLAA